MSFDKLKLVQQDLLKAVRWFPGIYGFDLINAACWECTERGGGEYRLSIGGLYVEMGRLEELGWVRSQAEPGGPERGGHDKKCWHLCRAID